MTNSSTVPPSDPGCSPQPSPPAASSVSGTNTPDSPLAPLSGESDRAFEAFRVYQELGPARRLTAVSRRTGVPRRTLERWAALFDWRGRLKAHTARCFGERAETETRVQRELTLDDATRARAFRDRQYALADALLDAAQDYLEGLENCDLDRMRFADACRALEIASRLGLRAVAADATDPAAPARSLRDQLAQLLDQACANSTPPTGGALGSPVPAAAVPQPNLP